MDSIRDGHPVERTLILRGPRGNGKTAMLRWIESEGQARGIQVVALDSAFIQTEAELIQRLSAPPKWIDRLSELSWRGLQWRLRERDADPIDQALAHRLRKAPLALLIDEAHVLDVEVGRRILSASQRLAGQGAPLLIVLAGTPELPYRLGKMQSTFWERSKILPFSRLEERDAIDAIRVPFEASRKRVSSTVLEEAASASHGYPYFLQIWGKALWGMDEAPATRVTETDVQRARAEFELERNQFYKLRYEELETLDLVAIAAAVASAYGSAQELHSSEIDDALELTLRRQGHPCDNLSVLEARRKLVSIGYIWRPGIGSGPGYARGIPSLMDYVRNAAGRVN